MQVRKWKSLFVILVSRWELVLTAAGESDNGLKLLQGKINIPVHLAHYVP